MDFKQIEKLMQAMEKSGIKRLALKEEGYEIELEREDAGSNHVLPMPQTHFFSTPMQMPALPPSSQGETPPTRIEAGSGKEEGSLITSPMVGTYYSSPSPEDPQFVKVGDEVREDTVICIIEAMKVMNEVKAGKRGKIKEIMLRNGDPVEFGTKIARII